MSNQDYQIFCADLESTGLLHHLVEQGDKAKLHNFCTMDVKDFYMTTYHTDYELQRKEIQSVLDKPTILIMHNGICYDKNALKHFGYNVDNVIFVDTLALSWYLDLNRDKHGLEDYGVEFGVPKPVVDDWESLTQQDYDHRVQEDVKIQIRTYQKLKRMFEELYGEMSDYDFCTHPTVKYLMFKMEQLEEQQNTKFRVDVPHAEATVAKLEQEILVKTEQLQASMPKVPEYSKHERPAKPFKKDGSLSATGEKWKVLCEEAGVDFDYEGEIKKIKCYNEPKPSSPQQIKDWLFSLGWKPETYKYVKDADGKERQIPQVYIQGSGGQVCKSIEKLAEEHEELQHLVGLGVLSHRKGCVSGFLKNLVCGEYVEASAKGFTNTLRLKHRAPCVNLPSSRVIYGEDVRACLVAKDGMLLGGADLSSLENRIKFNLQLPFDRNYVLSQMSDDFDPHLEIAQEGGLLEQHEVWFYKIVKEGFPRENYPNDVKLNEMLSLSEDQQKIQIKRISETRGKGKSTNYASQYGAGASTVARTAGVPLSTGKALVKAYKKVNWSIEQIAKQQVTKIVSHGTYLLNPYNNMWYHLKTDKDRFSTLVQGTGAYVLDLWLAYQFSLRKTGNYGGDKHFGNLLATFHDEQIIEFKEVFKEDAERLMKDAIAKVNGRFNLEIPFDCDVQFGKKYSEIH